uniref:Uncharacterized protein n=1 Tax=Anguilla anguilla TaxID=7936 RepID=A0A0E9RAW5_ANGAN
MLCCGARKMHSVVQLGGELDASKIKNLSEVHD